MFSANESDYVAREFYIRVITAVLFDKVDSLEIKRPNLIDLSRSEVVF
jgi:hypothetical protein